MNRKQLGAYVMTIYGEKANDVDYVLRPGVYGIAFDALLRVALVKVPFGYHLPGGGIEAEEDHESCLRRELLEETGYTIDIAQMINISHQYAYSERSMNYYELVGHFYVVTLLEKSAEPIELDHVLEWHTIDEAQSLLSLEYQREALKIVVEWVISDKKRFIDLLRNNYHLAPDHLSTAFWKYEAWINNDLAKIDSKAFGCVDVILERSLLYTNRNPHLLLEVLKEDTIDLIVSSNDVSESIDVQNRHETLLNQWKHERFFKLYKQLEMQKSNTITLDSGTFVFKPVEPHEISEVVDFINRSYVDIGVSEPEVLRWTRSDVYDPALWLWVIHKNTGTKAALGIAELDAKNSEGILEWIQVEASFRGEGLGVLLVDELTKRMGSKASLVTVSGDVDNETSPIKLYRKCGFEGETLWHIYRRKK